MRSVAVHVIWATPNIDATVVRVARVSNPSNEANMETADRLLSYLIRNREWSPFEHVYICLLITGASRAITRQVLRHRSFVFQEHSGRYAVMPGDAQMRVTMRMALVGPGNKQDSRPPVGWRERVICAVASGASCVVAGAARVVYRAMLKAGVARETARFVLPEGYAETRLYMTGSLRSWLHYVQLRDAPGVQAEHRELAQAVKQVLARLAPRTWDAFTRHG